MNTKTNYINKEYLIKIGMMEDTETQDQIKLCEKIWNLPAKDSKTDS